MRFTWVLPILIKAVYLIPVYLVPALAPRLTHSSLFILLNSNLKFITLELIKILIAYIITISISYLLVLIPDWLSPQFLVLVKIISACAINNIAAIFALFTTKFGAPFSGFTQVFLFPYQNSYSVGLQ